MPLPATTRPSAEPPESPAVVRAKSRLGEIQQEITVCGDKLLDDSLPARELIKTARRLQRLRIVALLQQEIIVGSADPTTYRELTLLNKMTLADDDPDNPDSPMQMELAEAAERLAGVGIDPDSAGTMVRIFNTLREAMNHGRDAKPHADEPEPAQSH